MKKKIKRIFYLRDLFIRRKFMDRCIAMMSDTDAILSRMSRELLETGTLNSINYEK